MTDNEALFGIVLSNSVATTSLAAAVSALLADDRRQALELLREAMAELREVATKLQNAVEADGS